MIDKIKKLLEEKPRHAIKMIFNNQELKNWILLNCDPNCIDNKTRVYTAITAEKVLCPCGSNIPRKLISIKDGLSFCAPANRCAAAKDSVSKNCIEAAKSWDKEAAKKKRAKTNLNLYSVENIGQTAKAKQAHFDLYQDKEKVNAILVRMQTTCKARYEVKNFQQKHISPESLNILQNKELFTEQLITFGRLELSKRLGVVDTTISLYHEKHELDIIKPLSSTHEFEIATWLATLNISHTKDRNICKPKELDFYIPSHKLALEVNGLYWHSEQRKSDKNYHFNKTEQCRNQDIQLIHIFEDEWIKNKEICKSIIAGRLNKITNIIPARKCQISEVSNKEIKSFLKENHLQGFIPGKHNLVLKFNNEIVAAITFGKPRYNKNIEWELLRLTSKCNTHIIGGTEKLWKYFLNNYSPNSIVSYCDKRWFTGQIYSKLGFCLKQVGKPTYWYTDCVERYHRSKYTKKNLLKLSKNLDINPNKDDWSTLTEAHITKNILGMDRIWDCGQDSWVWNR